MVSRLVPKGLGWEGACGQRARWSRSSHKTQALEEVADSAGHLSWEFKELGPYPRTHRYPPGGRTDGLWADKPSRLGCDKEVQGEL